MSTLVSIAVVVATVLVTEALVDGWIGEAGRFWFGIGGLALLVLASILIKASGIEAMTRYLRTAVIGAGIGAVLDRAGLRLGWLRSALRLFGVETDREGGPVEGRQVPRTVGPLFITGWATSLIGFGMLWTGVFAE